MVHELIRELLNSCGTRRFWCKPLYEVDRIEIVVLTEGHAYLVQNADMIARKGVKGSLAVAPRIHCSQRSLAQFSGPPSRWAEPIVL